MRLLARGALSLGVLLVTTGASLHASPPLPVAPSWFFDGGQEFGMLGTWVASAGDVNGDGYDDVLTSGPGFPSFSAPARALLFLGSPTGPQASPCWGLVQSQGSLDPIGMIAGAGDVNGDGYDDVLVARPSTFPASVSLYLGSPQGLPTTPAWNAYEDLPQSYFGGIVGPAGDVNGDGFADVVIAATGFGDVIPGRVFVYLGSASGPGLYPDWTVIEDAPSSGLGSAAAPADVNGDGYGDFLIGVPGYEVGQDFNRGRVNLYMGSPTGLATLPIVVSEGTEPQEFFGNALAGGDINRDGFDDVVVGADGYPAGLEPSGGRAFVYMGSGLGLSASPVWMVTGTEREEHVGGTVATSDVNGDGYADVVIGSSGYFNNFTNSGRLQLYPGSAAGPALTAAWDLSEGGSQQYYEYYANALANAGDVNGDGAEDLIGGTRFWQIYRGRTYVFEGTPVFQLVDPLCLSPTVCEGEYLVESNGVTDLDNDHVDHLAQAAVTRTAVVTDGVTELLVRMRSDVPVTFTLRKPDGSVADASLGILMDRLGGSPGSSVTIDPEATQDGSFAFARYRAPLDFPSPPGATQVLSTPRVIVEAATTDVTHSRSVRLIPPPYVLVHGVWSDASVWKRPGGGLYGDLQQRGFFTCPDCLVDYGTDEPAASFDPEADSLNERISIARLITATNRVRKELRAQGTAVTQVDVVGHSEGGLVARARVVTKLRHYSWKGNYGKGDFHKIITIGTPHRATPLAEWFLTHKCAPVDLFILDPTLAGLSKFLKMPLGPAIYGFQIESEPLEHLGVTPVPSHPIRGQAPPSSAVEGFLNWIISRTVAPPTTVDGLLGIAGNHDTVVPEASQQGMSGTSPSVVTGIVHAALKCTQTLSQVTCNATAPGEANSAEVWEEVARLLLTPINAPGPMFAPLPAYQRPGVMVPLKDEPCPSSLLSPDTVRVTSGSATILPAPGMLVHPGDLVAIDFGITGGNPIDGALFMLGDAPFVVEAAGPFVFDYVVPDDKAGRIDINAATYGPGPENYTASTYIVVEPATPPVTISIRPTELEMTLLGETAPLHVVGRLADTSEIDLTSPETGTTFGMLGVSGAVATVSPAGLVTATGAGSDAVIAHYGALTASMPIVVRITNRPPVLTPLAPVTMNADDALDVPIHAVDADGDPMALSVAALPPFATLVDQGGGNGTLMLRPAAGDVGIHSIHLEVTDSGLPPLGAGGTIVVTIAPPCPPAPTAQTSISVTYQDLSWTPMAGAATYDVVYGDLANFWITGDYQESLLGCLLSGSPATALTFATVPPAGGGFWFLVRGRNCGGPGTWDSGMPSQVDTREYLNLSPLACP
ncbi:MAG TPA: FG-GAP-like repeat-containing protein [Dongiaceae bacterium]|nr:FG-GAP-like repeat-containing protein [Dongiaceae bacterium]